MAQYIDLAFYLSTVFGTSFVGKKRSKTPSKKGKLKLSPEDTVSLVNVTGALKVPLQATYLTYLIFSHTYNHSPSSRATAL